MKEEKKQERREHRKRNRLRKKRKNDAIVNEVLVRFLEVLERKTFCVNTDEGNENFEALNSFRDVYQINTNKNIKNNIDWESFPADADPVTRIGVLKKTAKARGLRKRKQIEQIYELLRSWAILDVYDEKRKTVVDFGCGTGNLLLALAYLFPEHDFVGVDLNDTSIRLLNERIKETQMTNVRAKLSLIENFDEKFDVALALHVCGNATDAVLSACVEKKKSFVCVPCCVGKVQVNGHRSVEDMRKRLINSTVVDKLAEKKITEDMVVPIIQYPRSTLMRSICDEKTFMNVAKLADWSGNEDISAYEDTSHLVLPTKAKEAVEIDRAQWCKEKGYKGSISLIKLYECGLRNDLILGVIDFTN
jgi:2-polyprenyl-3-methyl-5-hydroxy-6-metoxy-1,4-benzoquinol methylase